MSKNDEKINYPSKLDKMVYSPMRKLFNLTSSVKKRLKRNSFEKRNKKNTSEMIIKSNNEKIKNNNQQKKISKSIIEINDNYINNYIQNNLKSSIFNTYTNDLLNNKNNNNYIQLQNNIININNNQYSYKKNIINNINSKNKRKVLSPSYKSYNNNNNNKKEKIQKNKKGIINNNKNLYSVKGVFKYKINKNNNKNKENKENKNNIPEIEMPYSSRYIFSSKKDNINNENNKNKINSTKTVDNDIERKKNKIKDIEINYRNTVNDLNMNKINNITEEIKHNSTITNFSINNEINNNNKKIKWINTNLMSLLENNIYSPKRCLSRIHSQENIYSNNTKKIINTENIKISKNKSVKDLSKLTYKKKNSSYKINKKDNIEEKTFNIKPDIYPEIKINLRNKNKVKSFNKNNSVIYESNKINNIFKENSSFVYVKNKITGRDTTFSSKQRKYKIINNTFCNNNPFFDIDSNEYILQDNINENEEISSFISYNELNYIIILLEKIKDIYDSLLSLENNNYLILKYFFEFINFIYNYNIDNYISNAIINIMNMEKRKILNNYFIFIAVVIYDLISKEKKLFNNLKILVKESIKLIYTNIIIIVNYSKDNINSKNNLFFEKIIKNINNKYTKNKELFIDDNEYLLIKKNNNLQLSPGDKINYNLNFIIRNIHTIINNMKKTKNYKFFMQIFQQINEISFENIYDFYINNILQVNIINSTLTTASKLFSNKNNTNNINISKNSYNNKIYTLLISLDETLIHFKIDTKNKGNNNKGVIQLRPWLTEFLSQIKPYYEIIAFSNGDKKYTDLIINSIDKNKIFFDNKLYRDHCIIMNNDFVKDINILGKDITKVIIVDNLIQNYRLNIDNGINIKSFYGEINDKILIELGIILIKIAKFGGDIRKGIKYYKDDIINKVSSNVYLNYYK